LLLCLSERGASSICRQETETFSAVVPRSVGSRRWNCFFKKCMFNILGWNPMFAAGFLTPSRGLRIPRVVVRSRTNIVSDLRHWDCSTPGLVRQASGGVLHR
jgi:hypothetical protein